MALLLIILWLLLMAVLAWRMCKVASDSDDIEEENEKDEWDRFFGH